MPGNICKQSLPFSRFGRQEMSDLLDFIQVAQELGIPLTLDELLMAIYGEPVAA